MNKSGLLLDIKQSNNCVYVKLLRIFLIGLTRKENELGNNISLTLGISKLHFTFIIGLYTNDTIDTNHGIS